MNFSKRINNRLHRDYSFLKRAVTIVFYNLFQKLPARYSLKRTVSNAEKKPLCFLGYNSEKERHVEFFPKDTELQQAVITCYFTRKPDPQLGFIRMTPDIKYIEPWYTSIVKLKIPGIIVHDGLDDDFIKTYSNPYVSFRKYTSGRYSIFEERWMAYYLFLAQSRLEKVFFTDIGDVIITRDPFELIKNPYTLYIGRDQAVEVGKSGWMMNELNAYIADSGARIKKSYYFQPVYNAGVVGGSRKLMLFFISEAIRKIMLTTTDCHKDMNILNLVIHDHFFPNLKIQASESIYTNILNDSHSTHSFLVSGYPLNSAFGKMQTDSGAVFIHK